MGTLHRKQTKLKIVVPHFPRKIRAVKKLKIAESFQKARDKKDKLGGSRYKLEEVIGKGGTGTVYKAVDLLLNMPVAVKFLNPEFIHDKDAISTLKEEARITMQLSHDNIVRLYGLQKAGENYFLVMEYVDGSTFRELLNMYGHFPMDSVSQIVEICSNAVSYAHQRGVLHDDLKPGNLLLTKDGILKIIDFGVAGMINAQQHKYIMGTPAYMSPEQIRGEALDIRTDVYSFGMIIYEFLTGKTIFSSDATVENIFNMEPAEMSGLPPEIISVLKKAIAPDYNDRWESIKAFSTAFRDACNAI